MPLSRFSYEVFRYMKSYDMVEENGHVLTGLSGGADSVCLFLCLKEISAVWPFQLSAMHVAHGIRGEEAEEDARFAKALAERFQVPFQLCHVDAPRVASEQGLSLEEAARNLRYGKLWEEAAKTGARIAVAHHMDDQAETVLFQLIRGSALKGLCGMQPVSGELIRPFLFLTREKIEAQLSACGESYRIDSTNADTAYARNRLRHTILPELSRINGGTVTHLARLAEEAGEIEDYLELQTNQAVLGTVRQEGNAVVLTISALLSLPELIKDRVLYHAIALCAGEKKDIGKVHVSYLKQLLLAEGGKRIELPHGVRAKKIAGTVILKKECT